MCIDATTRAPADLGCKAVVIQDASAAPDVEFGGVTVPAAQVHAANMAPLARDYGQVVDTRELLAQ
jgi:nicotinamidase-related amidase